MKGKACVAAAVLAVSVWGFAPPVGACVVEYNGVEFDLPDWDPGCTSSHLGAAEEATLVVIERAPVEQAILDSEVDPRWLSGEVAGYELPGWWDSWAEISIWAVASGVVL